jgi:Ulp1 family protease
MRSVLLGAQETYVNYNVDDKHWGLIRVHSQFKRCEIFDSTGHLKKKHGRELLNGYELLTGVDTSDWAVVVYESSASGMAQQKDGKSCGVFACITAAHLLHDAKLPDIQSKVVLWRRHIAVRIQTMPVVVVIRV